MPLHFKLRILSYKAAVTRSFSIILKYIPKMKILSNKNKVYAFFQQLPQPSILSEPNLIKQLIPQKLINQKKNVLQLSWILICHIEKNIQSSSHTIFAAIYLTNTQRIKPFNNKNVNMQQSIFNFFLQKKPVHSHTFSQQPSNLI